MIIELIVVHTVLGYKVYHKTEVKLTC